MTRPTTAREVRAAAALPAAVTAALLLLAGCGADPGDDGAAGSTSGPGAAPAAEGTTGDDAPTAAAGEDGAAGGTGTQAVRSLLPGASDLAYDPAAVVGTTLDGAAFDAASLDGPVVYWFWAPWCTVCRAESGDVAAAAAATAGEVTFVGVAGLGPQDDMAGFVADTGTDGFVHLADLDGSLWSTFGVVGQPSYVMVDADGQATLWPGALGAEGLDAVSAALAG